MLIELKKVRALQIKLLIFFEEKLKPHSIIQRCNWVVKINDSTICALDVNNQVICNKNMYTYTLFEEKTALQIRDTIVMKNCFGDRIKLVVLSENDFIKEQIISLKKEIEWSKFLTKN